MKKIKLSAFIPTSFSEEGLFIADGDPWYVEMTTLNTNTAPDTEDTASTGVNFTVVISVAIVSIAVVALARIIIKSGGHTEDAVVQTVKTKSFHNLNQRYKLYKPYNKTTMFPAPSLVPRQTTTGKCQTDPLCIQPARPSTINITGGNRGRRKWRDPSYGSSEACLNGSNAALTVDSLGACASHDDDEYTNCRSDFVPVATSEISGDLLASVLSEALREEDDGINFPHLYENDLPRSLETPELPDDTPELVESDPAIFPLAGASNVTGETGHEMTSPNMTEMTQIAHQVPVCDTGQAEKRRIPCGSPNCNTNSSRRKVSTL
ncbi:hypothetical protein BaRGS_00029129 [Batillaria attramentaria]|uniref:Uncharacterized protein n=1 Tax=Batillaria attramentaria TaxID=370345 RepID=A0ABD0JXZ9_9CAEN